MSIIGDIYYKEYGEFIEAADKYSKRIREQLLEENKTMEQKLNFKIDNLEKMLFNVCENVYKLNAGLINNKQLLSIVNGCLDSTVIDKFTWDYLTDEESKKLQTHKKIQDAMKKYIHDYDDVEIKTDEIDESGSPVIITSQKNIYEGNLTQQDIEDAFKEEE